MEIYHGSSNMSYSGLIFGEIFHYDS